MSVPRFSTFAQAHPIPDGKARKIAHGLNERPPFQRRVRASYIPQVAFRNEGCASSWSACRRFPKSGQVRSKSQLKFDRMRADLGQIFTEILSTLAEIGLQSHKFGGASTNPGQDGPESAHFERLRPESTPARPTSTRVGPTSTIIGQEPARIGTSVGATSAGFGTKSINVACVGSSLCVDASASMYYSATVSSCGDPGPGTSASSSSASYSANADSRSNRSCSWRASAITSFVEMARSARAAWEPRRSPHPVRPRPPRRGSHRSCRCPTDRGEQGRTEAAPRRSSQPRTSAAPPPAPPSWSRTRSCWSRCTKTCLLPRPKWARNPAPRVANAHVPQQVAASQWDRRVRPNLIPPVPLSLPTFGRANSGHCLAEAGRAWPKFDRGWPRFPQIGASLAEVCQNSPAKFGRFGPIPLQNAWSLCTALTLHTYTTTLRVTRMLGAWGDTLGVEKDGRMDGQRTPTHHDGRTPGSTHEVAKPIQSLSGGPQPTEPHANGNRHARCLNPTARVTRLSPTTRVARSWLALAERGGQERDTS